MNTKNLEVHVEDDKVWLNTKDEILALPKAVLETMLTELVKEIRGSIPKNNVDKKLQLYIELLEHRVKLWKITAFVITGIYLVWSIFRLCVR